jgi:argininosuccinate synthase
MPRIVLAYSGGLDTSVAIPWLREHHGAEVVALTLDVGQRRELAGIRERALAAGAVRAHVVDAREEFARDFVVPALRAGALYEDEYPLASALARPLVARHLVAVAGMEGATVVAHGGTGKGNGQARLQLAVRALDPRIAVLAPARAWRMTRPEEIDFARARGIPVPATLASPYSTDENLWGRSVACGALEDPWAEPPEDVFVLTKPAAAAPDTPAYVEIAIEQGVPTAVNDVAMPFAELVASLETIAGAHGVGRIDMIENRLVGIKSREVHEAPAAAVLHAAVRALEALVLPRDLARLARQASRTYADLVYDGLWFTPAREALDAFFRSVHQRVTGTVRLRLFKGDCRVVGRRSPVTLYDHALATYGEGDAFDHAAAEGFVRMLGLPVETAARALARVGAPAGGRS